MSKAFAAEMNSALALIANHINKTYPPADISFRVNSHFIERLLKRYGQNFGAALVDVLKAIVDNICLVIYYRHIETILPERGRIPVGDQFEIRGNVVDNKYVLSTFVES